MTTSSRCTRLRCPRLDCPPACQFPIRVIITTYRFIPWPLWHCRLDNLARGHLNLLHRLQAASIACRIYDISMSACINMSWWSSLGKASVVSAITSITLDSKIGTHSGVGRVGDGWVEERYIWRLIYKQPWWCSVKEMHGTRKDILLIQFTQDSIHTKISPDDFSAKCLEKCTQKNNIKPPIVMAHVQIDCQCLWTQVHIMDENC